MATPQRLCRVASAGGKFRKVVTVNLTLEGSKNSFFKTLVVVSTYVKTAASRRFENCV